MVSRRPHCVLLLISASCASAWMLPHTCAIPTRPRVVAHGMPPLSHLPHARATNAHLSLLGTERGKPSSADAQKRAEERRPQRGRGDDETSADPSLTSGGAAAAGVLASSAVIAEAVQIAGTAVLFYFGQQWTGTDSPVEAVSAMIDYLQQQPGLVGYEIFAAWMIFLQVVPIAAAFVLTVSAGAIFGAVKGTATVLTCSTISASISFLISRTFGRERLLDAAQESKQYRAIDAAFANASYSTSLTLITLLRLSPVLPFAWANYVFGLSPVPLSAFSIGTFVGCFPAVAGYVSAGQVGAEIAVNGAESNPLVLGLGVAATLGAISFAGNIATNALKDLDVDLGEE